jgi:drug/metabolite transporter (DMT)-like permease
MGYLFTVSLVWAFSFGLIKGNLTNLDSNFVAWARILVSFLVFAPLIRIRGTDRRLIINLVLTGIFQFGVMYITYIYSYHYLKAYEVALFTIFTPLFVTIINDLYQKNFHKLFFITSLCAVAGAAIIVYTNEGDNSVLKGILILQISNGCFAFGQIHYKRIKAMYPDIRDKNVFGLLYLGALAVTSVAAGVSTGWTLPDMDFKQLLTLLYLGILASGVCFFLWNVGATRSSPGTLAVFNNVKIPLAVACSLVFFGESADIVRLLAGGGVMLAAVLVSEKYKSPRKQSPSQPRN